MFTVHTKLLRSENTNPQPYWLLLTFPQKALCSGPGVGPSLAPWISVVRQVAGFTFLSYLLCLLPFLLQGIKHDPTQLLDVMLLPGYKTDTQTPQKRNTHRPVKTQWTVWQNKQYPFPPHFQFFYQNIRRGWAWAPPGYGEAAWQGLSRSSSVTAHLRCCPSRSCGSHRWSRWPSSYSSAAAKTASVAGKGCWWLGLPPTPQIPSWREQWTSRIE